MDLKWQDAEDIAIRLVEEYPKADPLTVRFTDMHAWIVALPDLSKITLFAFDSTASIVSR